MFAPHNIYIHVPFCAQKCAYCAFYSVACEPDWNTYESQLISEIKDWGGRLGHPAVPTIFFGGGTPSLMPTAIFAKIMDALRANFAIAPDAEITLEANPGTIDVGVRGNAPATISGAFPRAPTKLQDFVAAGVNRLSIGVQSFDDSELKFLGRIHTAADAVNLIRTAQDVGLRVSGDFIYALPNQSVASVEKLCHGILALGLTHASLYELSIEPGTPLAARGIKKIANDLSAQMFDAIGNILSNKLPRYEVSNYAAPGHECRHNQNIWAGEPYVGIGPSAAGRPLMDGQWFEQEYSRQFQNEMKPMDVRVRATEKIMTGLRTIRGVALTPDVHALIDWEYVETHPDLFIRTDINLSLAPNGLLILDNLLVNLIR